MKYKIVGGKKYLVTSAGVFFKDVDGNNIEVTEEQAVSLEEVKEGEATPADAPADANIDNDAVVEMKNYIATLAGKEAKEAVKALNLIDGFSSASRKAFAEAFADGMKASNKKDALNVESIKKDFASVKSTAGRSMEFEVKSLSELNSLTGLVIETDRDPEITRTPQREVLIEAISNTGGTTSNKVTWVEVLTETGAPATTAELANFAEKDYTFGVYETPVLKVTVMTKHSIEILEDMPALVAMVKEMITEDLNLKVDEKLFNGAGTAGEFNGVYTQAPAFSAGTMVVVSPNRIDVLRAACTQIAVAGKKRFLATDIILNPIDAALMDMTKDANGAYVMPPFTTADRTVIKGVRIVENVLMPVGNFLAGDFRKHKVRTRRGVTVQVATENGTDFEKDILTIRASKRLANYIRTNENGAFVKGVFATAITDLTS